MEGAPTQLVGRDGSPVRMSMRDVSPRRSYVQKKQMATGPVQEIIPVTAMVPQQYERETQYVGQKSYDLVIPEKTVQKIMGPEPIPAIDIEFDEIQNELQKKLVDEISCTMCKEFPYMPLECKACHKIFCQHCQLTLQKNPAVVQDELVIEKLMEEDGEMLDRSPAARKAQRMQWLGRKNDKSGRFNRDRYQYYKQQNNYEAMMCTHCKCKGDFLVEVNPIVRNCVDFCEFPHKCNKASNGEVLWKSVRELQKHAQYDECPKYGCDICYLGEFQHMTRTQLREHIKRFCPEVMVQCQVCVKEFRRGEFAKHQCLKDYYMQKLKANHIDVVEFLAEKMMKFKRQQKRIAVCQNIQCLDRYRSSGQHKYEGMMVTRTNQNPVKCCNCTIVTQGQEEAFYCQYCNENYCTTCLGFNLFYDLQELEDLLLK